MLAVNNRNGSAPETLTRDPPIPDAIRDRTAAKFLRLGIISHFPHRLMRELAAPLSTVHQHSVFGERIFHIDRLIGAGNNVGAFTLLAVNHGSNHLANRQGVLARKLEIALVVRRYAHHCARAVIHQYIVRHPYRQQLSAERIHSEPAGINSQFLFFRGRVFRFDCACGFYFFRELHHLVCQ